MSFSQGVGHCERTKTAATPHPHTHTHTLPMASPFPSLSFWLLFITKLPYMLLSYFVSLSPLLQGKCHGAVLYATLSTASRTVLTLSKCSINTCYINCSYSKTKHKRITNYS